MVLLFLGARCAGGYDALVLGTGIRKHIYMKLDEKFDCMEIDSVSAGYG